MPGGGGEEGGRQQSDNLTPGRASAAMGTPLRQKSFNAVTPASARRQLRDITNSNSKNIEERRLSMVTTPMAPSKLRQQISLKDLEELPIEYASLPPTGEQDESCCFVPMIEEENVEYVPLESYIGRMAREYNDPERHMREVNETIRMLESVYLSTPQYLNKEISDDCLEPPYYNQIRCFEDCDKN